EGAEVTELRRGGDRLAGSPPRVVAPIAELRGLAGRDVVGGVADEAAHRVARLFHLDGRDVEPGQDARLRAGGRLVERRPRRRGGDPGRAARARAPVAVAAARARRGRVGAARLEAVDPAIGRDLGDGGAHEVGGVGALVEVGLVDEAVAVVVDPVAVFFTPAGQARAARLDRAAGER